ncbi:MAG: tetratricopeptide repeat protein [Blastocatellia bacterium]
MKAGLIGLFISAIFCAAGFAQTASNPSPAGALAAALAVESPAERIVALQKFLRTNSIPEQALAAREAIVASYAQMGESQLAENEIERAAENFRRATGGLPDRITDQFFEETVIRIPLAVSVRGYRSEAIAIAQTLEKRFAKEAPRLARIGEFYLTIEAPGDAIRALEAASALAEEDSTLHRALAAAYRMGLRLDDAIAEYQQAVKYDQKDRRAYYELGNLYRAHGAYADAIGLYQKQLQIDPKHASSYKGLALTHLAQGREDEAASALNQARDIRGGIEEITQDIYLQTQIAFHYLGHNKLKQARQAAEAALMVEPRYAWARIAAAEVDMAEGKYFDAERNLLAAKSYASFPTLFFTLGKLYLAVEDFDGAQEQFAKAFTYSQQSQFTTRLGGALEVRAETIRDLLSREHQAAIYLAESPTPDEQFKIAESLVKFNVRLKMLTAPPPINRPARGQQRSAPPGDSPESRRKLMEELDQAAMGFVEAENVRRSFRMLYIAERLAQAAIAPGLAIELAEQALGLAEVATESEGSVRDYPNYDRNGRLQIFRGRSLDAKGWAQFKSGKAGEAAGTLNEALRAYGAVPERKRALMHLASVRESAGDLSEALELYISAYEPAENSRLDVNRAVIESLYRKVHGSLDGLDKRLGIPVASAEAVATTASLAPGKTDLKAKAGAAQKPGPMKPVLPPARTVEPAPARTVEPAFRLPAAAAVVELAPAMRPGSFPSREAPGADLPAIEPTSPPPAAPLPERSSPPAPAPQPVGLPVIELAEILPGAPLSLPTWIWVASVIKGQPAQFHLESEEPPPPPPGVHTRKRRVDVPNNPPSNP